MAKYISIFHGKFHQNPHVVLGFPSRCAALPALRGPGGQRRQADAPGALLQRHQRRIPRRTPAGGILIRAGMVQLRYHGSALIRQQIGLPGILHYPSNLADGSLVWEPPSLSSSSSSSSSSSWLSWSVFAGAAQSELGRSCESVFSAMPRSVHPPSRMPWGSDPSATTPWRLAPLFVIREVDYWGIRVEQAWKWGCNLVFLYIILHPSIHPSIHLSLSIYIYIYNIYI